MGSHSLERALVLDTCAWLWIAQGDSRINPKIQAKLAKADWVVSAISVWEVAMLVAKGRLELDCSIEKWIRRALIEVPRLNLAPLIPEISIMSCNLPEYEHSDPADNIILATAMYHKAAIVTGDKRMIDYCNSGYLPVIAV